MDKQLRRNLQPGVLEDQRLKNLSTIIGAGVIFLALDTGRCLFQLRNSDKRQKHTWGFWGGLLENNETPYECIKRELDEEIGMVPELQKLNPIDVYQSRNKHFMYYSFVYVIDKEFIPHLNDESAGYAWVNIGNWPRPLHEGAQKTLYNNKGLSKLQTILEVNSK